MPAGQPATPSELGELQASYLPCFVFDAINSLLGRNRTFTVQEAITAIMAKSPDFMHHRMSEFLEFEDAYRTAGWEVAYIESDRLDSNGIYQDRYVFTKR